MRDLIRRKIVDALDTTLSFRYETQSVALGNGVLGEHIPAGTRLAKAKRFCSRRAQVSINYDQGNSTPL